FTGAAARSLGRFETVGDGTLFLDEIGEISMPTQVKLLRVLENRTFERVGGSEQIPMKARLIAATNRNLAAMVKDGAFREDLFYRLNVVTIEIPPLRKRKEDIPPLLDFFLKRNGDAKARGIVAFSNEAVNMLTAYDWPGNVRELRNCVERMTVFSRGPVLTLGDVPAEIRQSIAMQFEQEKNSPAQPVVATEALDVKSNEKALILKVLEDCKGNRSHAAEKLNISRRTLQRKLHEYGIQ
ncbi:MAG: sigma-54-dependent Fis family transcriptional regulator, partial [Victivallales bacterium]|nr:sigma-54-dependent Fis family transcriptional regulator [Victivallales bacterium]